MKEEQKNLTLGQIADMKHNLEENIKNQIIDFMNQTGVQSAEINTWFNTFKEVTKEDTVETKIEGNIKINLINFLND